MLQIDQTIMRGITKLPIFLHLDKPSINYTILPHPPLEKLQIFVILTVTMKIDRILLHILISQVVSVQGHLTKLTSRCYLEFHLMPVLPLKLRQTI